MTIFQRIGLGVSSATQSFRLSFQHPRLFKYYVLVLVEFLLAMLFVVPVVIGYAAPALISTWFSAIPSGVLLAGTIFLGVVACISFIALWLTMIELLREVSAIMMNRERTADERWHFSWLFIGRVLALIALTAGPGNLVRFIPGVAGTIAFIIVYMWQLMNMFALPIMIVQQDRVLVVIKQSIQFFYEHLAAVFGFMIAMLGYVLALSLTFLAFVLTATYLSKMAGIIVGVLLFMPFILFLMIMMILPIVFYIDMRQKAL